MTEIQLSKKEVASLSGRLAALDSIPELAGIKAGKEGLIQLIKSNKGVEIDARIKNGSFPDTPIGPPLKSAVRQISRRDRTVQYKNSVLKSYNDALSQTVSTLNTLAEGQNVEGAAIRAMVEDYVKLFMTDASILFNMSGTKPVDEEYIYHHSLNVCILSLHIAAAHGYSEQQVIEIGMGALLHDVGMLLIPVELRNKIDRLTEDEWFEIQKHPILGLHLLKNIRQLPEAVPIVAYQSHERENGKGYPKQRSSRLIHNYAKIVCVADIFEAFTSRRTYRGPLIPYKSMELVIKMTNQGLISGEFVKSLMEYASLFPVGSIVELTNGCIGKVIRANGISYAKPTICVLIDEKGMPLPPDKIYEEDLSFNTNLQIVRAHPQTVACDDIMQGF